MLKLGNPLLLRTRFPLDTTAATVALTIATVIWIGGALAVLFIALPRMKPSERWMGVVVPIAISCVTAGMWRIRRAHVRARRALHGLCMDCGYDLRESGERCPECGAPNPAWG